MEIEDIYVDEIFDFNPNQSEIYSTTPQENLSTINNPSSSSSLSSSSSSSSAPKLISFENSQVLNFSSGKVVDDDDDIAANEIFMTQLNTNNNNNNKKKNCSSSTGRTILQARDHVVAEKKRRHNLNQLFISLSQVVPGLKKLDKASVMENAIEHLKELEERVRVLEQEINLTDFINTYSTINDSNNYPSNDETIRLAENNNSESAEIKVRISDKHVLIKIHCKKQKGLMSGVPRQLEEIHLNVLDMRIMPFGSQSHLDITLLAQMQSEFKGTVKDIVDHLQIRLFVNPKDQHN